MTNQNSILKQSTIINNPLQQVEGVIYELKEDNLQKLEIYLKFHEFLWIKRQQDIIFANSSVPRYQKAWVYFLNPKNIIENKSIIVNPESWYINNMLVGKQFYSETYYKSLRSLKILDQFFIQESNNLQFYFGYGSNMDPDKVLERVGPFKTRQRAVLLDYNLTFDQVSHLNEESGYASIIHAVNQKVEGCLYIFNQDQILKLDMYEGLLNGEYNRQQLEVDVYDMHMDKITIKSWVYIAQNTQKGRLPRKWYLQHLLQGQDVVSSQYYQKLLRINTCD